VNDHSQKYFLPASDSFAVSNIQRPPAQITGISTTAAHINRELQNIYSIALAEASRIMLQNEYSMFTSNDGYEDFGA